MPGTKDLGPPTDQDEPGWAVFEITRQAIRQLGDWPGRPKYNEVCLAYGACAWCANRGTRRLTPAAYRTHWASWDVDTATGEVELQLWDNAHCVECTAIARGEPGRGCIGAETFVPDPAEQARVAEAIKRIRIA